MHPIMILQKGANFVNILLVFIYFSFQFMEESIQSKLETLPSSVKVKPLKAKKATENLFKLLRIEKVNAQEILVAELKSMYELY